MSWDVLITGMAALLGVGIGLVPYLLERREKYRFEEYKRDLEIKYQARIKAHQEAFAWVNELGDAFTRLEKQKIWEIVNKARRWWNSNCFYLDKDSRARFLDLLWVAPSFASERVPKEEQDYQKKVWALLDNTLDAIQSGIRAERLDVFGKSAAKEVIE